MRRMDLKRTVTAFSLAAMVISSLTLGGNINTVEAASKQNVLTKATYNDGATVKYSYNKKGLVTKSVRKKSSKTSDTDVSVTVTTKYKYNKKNKVSSKTAKTVTTTTYYDTDKTTGLNIVGTKGTVTEIETADTKYTYNKKGLAKESVTTTTTTKSGETTTVSNGTDRFYYANDDYYKKYPIKKDFWELSDGRVLAGYNYYNADGTKNHEDTIANAYYYNAPLALNHNIGNNVTTRTVKYTDNGDGTYTEAVTTDSKTSGVEEEEVRQYYAKITVNGQTTIVPITRVEEQRKDEDGNTYTYITYKDAAGSYYYYWDFYVITGVNEKLNSASSSGYTDTDTDIITDKKVATTKYTYDKKKRVKKEVTTTVSTNDSLCTEIHSENKAGNGSSSSSDYTDKTDTKSESTSVSTTSYSYDKKGRAKKIVVSDNGVKDSTETVAKVRTQSSDVQTTTNTDGSISTTTSSSTTTCDKDATGADIYPTVTTTVVKDGVKSVTETSNGFTEDYTNSHPAYINGVPTTITTTGKITVSYTANGGSKTVASYSSNGGATTFTNTTYRFDEYGESTAEINAEGKTYTANDKSYYWNDLNPEATPSAEKTQALEAMNASIAAVDASIAPFSKTDTETELAAPSKETTKYTYDKKGNVKSAKASGTTTKIVIQKDETYGNPIYEFDSVGKLREKKIAVTHKYTNKDSMENTVKQGTKNLTKVYTSRSETKDRNNSKESIISRVKYTIKGKKASAAKISKKQQWILQNGDLNGQVGLN